MSTPVRKRPALVALGFVGLFGTLSVSGLYAVVPSPPSAAASTALARASLVSAPLGRVEREDHGRADIPTVWFDVTSPTTDSTASVKINWCDDVSLVANSRYFTLRGTAQTVGYTTGSSGGCAAYASTTVTVSLVMGPNALYSKIRGDNFEWGESYGEIIRIPIVRGVEVTPDGSVVSKTATTATTQYLQIRNTGNVPTTFGLTATCVGLTGCSLSASSMTVAAGTTDSVYVSYTSGGAGSFGRIDVTADSGGVTDDAYVTVSVPPAAPTADYPVVDVSNTQPGTTNEKSACLSISLGANSAAECGYLRIVHPLATITTHNKARTPTLIYNAGTNRPYPIFAADVSIPPGSSGAPDSVKATLKIGASPVVDSGKWAGSAWSVGGPSRRIGLGYNAAGSGTAIRSYTESPRVLRRLG